MDVFFKNLHKNKGTFGMSNTAQRAENLNLRRRETRGNLMLQRRNIDKNMTPLPTPEPTRIQPQVPEPKRNKRLEMLQKWKDEKERLKKLEKKNKKPVFKVSAVHNEIGLPNLDKVNHTIKGKLITPICNEFTRHNRFKQNHVLDKNKESKKNVNNIQEVEKRNAGAVGTNYNFSNLPKNKNSARTQWTESRVQSVVQNAKVPKVKNTPNAEKKFNAQKKVGKDKSNPVKSSTSRNTPPIVKSSPKRKLSSPKRKLTPFRRLRGHVDKNANASPDQVQLRINISPKKDRKSVFKNKKVSIIDLTESPLEDKVSSKKKIRKTPYLSRIKKHSPFIVAENLSQRFLRSSLKVSSDTTSETDSSLRDEVFEDENNQDRDLNETYDIEDNTGENTCSGVLTNLSEKAKEKSKERRRSSKQSIAIPNIEKKTKDRKTKSKISSQNGTKLYEKSLSGSAKREKTNSEDQEQSPPIENGSDNATTNSRKIARPTRKNRKSLPVAAESSMSIDHPLSNASDVENSGCAEKSEFTETSSGTPNNNVKTPPVVYVSPFVTVSRGKNSARKEYRARNSRGGTLSDDSMISRLDSSSTSPKTGAVYFKTLLTKETERIENMCAIWSDYKDITQPNESACDLINTTVGQARLLTSSKFKQFSNLINRCEDGDNMVTCQDLHGFWEMMYQQVGDVEKRFQNLERLRESGWKEVTVEHDNKVKGRAAANKKKRPQDVGKGKRMRNEHLREAIKAARLKAMQGSQHSKTGAEEAHDAAFDVDFFMAGSPLMKHGSRKSARKSLLASALTNSIKRRSINADHIGRAVMAATQTVRRSFGTPAKSILKTDGSSKGKHNKSVLFMDSLLIEDKENAEDLENNLNQVNLVNFSPVGTPIIRRSSRIRFSRNKLF